MIFAILSLIAAVGGFIFVGISALDAGYFAGQVMVSGGVFVSVAATLLAATSFIRKETRTLSVLALVISLTPVFILSVKLMGDLYDHLQHAQNSEASAGRPAFAQPAPPAFAVEEKPSQDPSSLPGSLR